MCIYELCLEAYLYIVHKLYFHIKFNLEEYIKHPTLNLYVV